MRTHSLVDMVKGWFVGDFEPVALQTKQFEVACKYYAKGDYEASHVHKIATEITVIVSGSAKMNGTIYRRGDIVTIDPGEATDFAVLEDNTITVVVKTPSVMGDKYVV